MVIANDAANLMMAENSASVLNETAAHSMGANHN